MGRETDIPTKEELVKGYEEKKFKEHIIKEMIEDIKKISENEEQIKKIKDLLSELKEEIKEKYKSEIIGIFGSYVRSEQKKRSDLDVLVKFHDGATLIDFVGLAFFLEEKLELKKVDVVPFDAVRPELKERIFKEAVYL